MVVRAAISKGRIAGIGKTSGASDTIHEDSKIRDVAERRRRLAYGPGGAGQTPAAFGYILYPGGARRAGHGI